MTRETLLANCAHTFRMLKEIAERRGPISSRGPGETKFTRTTLAKVVALECGTALAAIDAAIQEPVSADESAGSEIPK